MTTIDNGGTAFPCEQSETQDGRWNMTFDPGMTLRQWYAGMALQGRLSGPEAQGETIDHSVMISFYAADAMIAHERREREEQEKANATPAA